MMIVIDILRNVIAHEAGRHTGQIAVVAEAGVETNTVDSLVEMEIVLMVTQIPIGMV